MEKVGHVDTSRKAISLRVGLGTIAYALIRLKGIVTLPIVTRLLGPENYGIYSMISNTASMVWPIASLNLGFGCATFLVHQRKRNEIAQHYYSALYLSSVTTLLGAVLLIVSSEWTGLTRSLGPYVGVAAFYLLLSNTRELAVLPLQTFQRTKELVSFNLLSEFGAAVIGVLVLVFGFGFRVFVWGPLIFMSMLTAFVLARNVCLYGFYPRIDWTLVKKFTSVSLPLLPVSFSQWALQSLDSFFIAHYLGTVAVGINSVAYSFAGMVQGMLVVLNYVYYPTLVAFWDRGPHAFYEAVNTSVRYVTVLCGLAVVGFTAAAEPIVHLLAAREFGDAASLIPIVVAAYGIHIITQMYRAATLTLEKNVAPVARGYLIGLVCNLLLNPIVIPVFGLTGAALNTLFSYGVTHLLVINFGRKRSNGAIEWRHQVRVVLPTVCGTVVAWLITGHHWVNAFLALIIGISVFVLVAFKNGLLAMEDFKLARKFVLEVLYG